MICNSVDSFIHIFTFIFKLSTLLLCPFQLLQTNIAPLRHELMTIVHREFSDSDCITSKWLRARFRIWLCVCPLQQCVAAIIAEEQEENEEEERRRIKESVSWKEKN